MERVNQAMRFIIAVYFLDSLLFWKRDFCTLRPLVGPFTLGSAMNGHPQDTARDEPEVNWSFVTSVLEIFSRRLDARIVRFVCACVGNSFSAPFFTTCVNRRSLEMFIWRWIFFYLDKSKSDTKKFPDLKIYLKRTCKHKSFLNYQC